MSQSKIAPTVTLPIAPVCPGGTANVIVHAYGFPETGAQLLDQPPKVGDEPLFGVVSVTVTPTGKLPVHKASEAPAEQLIPVTVEVPPGNVYEAVTVAEDAVAPTLYTVRVGRVTIPVPLALPKVAVALITGLTVGGVAGCV